MASAHERLQRTASHAAGHALSAWYWRRPLETVRLEASAPDDGRCATYGTWPPDLLQQAPCTPMPPHQQQALARSIDVEVGILLAGPLAEARVQYTRLPRRLTGTDDHRRALALVRASMTALGHPAEGDTCQRYVFGVQSTIIRFVRREDTWRAIGACADALLQHGTLEGPPLHDLLAHAYGRRQFPRRWWRALTIRTDDDVPPSITTWSGTAHAVSGTYRTRMAATTVASVDDLSTTGEPRALCALAPWDGGQQGGHDDVRGAGFRRVVIQSS